MKLRVARAALMAATLTLTFSVLAYAVAPGKPVPLRWASIWYENGVLRRTFIPARLV